MSRRPIKQSYLFADDILTIHWGEDSYRIHAWPKPQAWIHRESRGWCRHWPDFRFINYPVKEKKKAAKKVEKPAQLKLGLEFAPVSRWVSPYIPKKEAFERIRQQIPFWYAMALARFNSHQWNPLVFLSFNRDFYDLLKSSPVLAFYLANYDPVAGQIYKGPRDFLPRMIAAKQTELLGLLGLPQTRQMLGIIRKILPVSANPWDDYAVLQKAVVKPDALKMLSHLEQINAGVLALVGADADILRLVTPKFLEDVSQDGRNHCHSSIIQDINDCRSLHGRLRPAETFPVPQDLAWLRRFYDDLVAEDLRQRAVERRPFDAPPIPDTENIQALTTPMALYNEGVEQGNCVGGYVVRVRSGSCYIYRVLQPERATLSISKQNDQWMISDIKARFNQPVKPETESAVRAWLDEHQLGVGGTNT